MNKRTKLLQRLRNNPKTVKFEEPRSLLETFGFVLVRVAGSHHIFELILNGEEITLVIPFRRGHLNSHYVKEALNAIEKIEKGIDSE